MLVVTSDVVPCVPRPGPTQTYRYMVFSTSGDSAVPSGIDLPSLTVGCDAGKLVLVDSPLPLTCSPLLPRSLVFL